MRKDPRFEVSQQFPTLPHNPPRTEPGWLERAGGPLLRVLLFSTLALVALLVLFFNLGAMSFIDPDEGRYALAAREMWENGNWLMATINLVPYPDKPAPFFWLLGLLLHLFDAAEWGARLTSALPALGTLILVFYWSRYNLGFASAICSTAVLLTAGEFVVLSRVVRMDALLTLTISTSLFLAYQLLRGTWRSWWWMIYLAGAIGLLMKGPVALLLPTIIVMAYALITGHLQDLHALRPRRGLLLLAAIAGCWYGPATIIDPQQVRTFIVDHNFARFFTGKVGHPEPWYFFLWVLPACFLPWSIFLPATLRRAASRMREGNYPVTFLMVWCTVTFCLFSFSRAKLAPYVLPMFPALAILTGDTLAGLWQRTKETNAPATWRLSCRLWLGLSTTAGVGSLVLAAAGPRLATGPLLLLGLLLVLSSLLSLQVLRKKRERFLPVVVFSTSTAVFLLLAASGAEVMSELGSLEQAVPAASALPRRTRLYAYKTHGYSLSYYSGKRITQLNTAAKAAALLEQEEPRAVLIRKKHLPRLQGFLASPTTVWWQGKSEKVLLANRLPPPGQQRYGLLLPLPRSKPVAVTRGGHNRYRLPSTRGAAIGIHGPPLKRSLWNWMTQLPGRLTTVPGG